MSILWGDTETRSECNLPMAGAYNYAQHPSTQLLLFNWAFDDEEVEEVVIRKPKPKAKPEPTYNELIYESAQDRIKTKIYNKGK
jgi:hypothetical protein